MLLHTFKAALLETTAGADLEHNKYVGQFSTIMRALTSKDGDLLSHFDKIDETQDGINNSSLKHILINNHTEVNRKKWRSFTITT